MARAFTILDVFTTDALSGNPLAVVHDGGGLDTLRMQKIAGEFNLSETVFLLPPENPLHTARLRIFTPSRELPFAGHPTVGSAVAIALLRAHGAEATPAVLMLEETVGPIRCGVTLAAGGGKAVFDAPRPSEETGPAPSVDDLAAALGLAVADIGFENHRPTVFSAGNPLVFVPIKNLATLAGLRPNVAAPAFSGPALFLYTRETVAIGRQFHARMFAPGLGIGEDPATGSAAVALSGVIRKFDPLADGAHRIAIEQGFEMGRPSLMHLEIDVAGGAITAVRLGGDAVVVATGTLNI